LPCGEIEEPEPLRQVHQQLNVGVLVVLAAGDAAEYPGVGHAHPSEDLQDLWTASLEPLARWGGAVESE
jgi:hypothetical protein